MAFTPGNVCLLPAATFLSLGRPLMTHICRDPISERASCSWISFRAFFWVPSWSLSRGGHGSRWVLCRVDVSMEQQTIFPGSLGNRCADWIFFFPQHVNNRTGSCQGQDLEEFLGAPLQAGLGFTALVKRFKQDGVRGTSRGVARGLQSQLKSHRSLKHRGPGTAAFAPRRPGESAHP